MEHVEMKSAFLSSPRSLYLLKNFIVHEMGIKFCEVWSHQGQSGIDVSMTDYERVITEGRKFVVQNHLKFVYWINYYNQLVSSWRLQLALVQINRKQNSFKDIEGYLQILKQALQTEVFCSTNQYNRTLCIESKEWDYDRQHTLLCNCLKSEGLGPFSNVSLLTTIGKPIEEATELVKIKK